MSRPRIAFFGSDSRFSEASLRALAAGGVVVAVIAPPAPRQRLHAALRRIAGRPPRPSLRACAAALGLPVITAGGNGDDSLAGRLRQLRPDVHCIALYPRKLSAELIAVAPLGAINAHPSLLPRHRGPLPLLWTYHADDREAGVTVHRASDRLDAGDVLVQEAFTLPRGHPVAALDAEVTARAAPLLVRAVAALAGGGARERAQDESAATYAPIVRPGQRLVDFDSWDVERVWHFLAALASGWREPLVDERGSGVAYDGVGDFQRSGQAREPGTVETTPAGWRLHCRGGTVALTAREGAS